MRIAHHSLAGGTDICSLFAGMCTALPVFRGEIQCRLLGMAVEAFTPTGTVAGPDEAGELVCLRPFPCMPAGFWPLPGYGPPDAVESAQKRYQDAYFSEFKGVWCESSLLRVSRPGDRVLTAYVSVVRVAGPVLVRGARCAVLQSMATTS